MSEWVSFDEESPEAGNLVQQYLGHAVLDHTNPPYFAFPEAVRWKGDDSRDSAATHWRYLDPPR